MLWWQGDYSGFGGFVPSDARFTVCSGAPNLTNLTNLTILTNLTPCKWLMGVLRIRVGRVLDNLDKLDDLDNLDNWTGDYGWGEAMRIHDDGLWLGGIGGRVMTQHHPYE
jgi:hypothetical protein